MVRRFAMPNNHIAFENKDYYIEIGLIENLTLDDGRVSFFVAAVLKSG